MYCKKCGKQLEEKVIFCSGCGTNLIDDEVRVDEEKPISDNTVAKEQIASKTVKKNPAAKRVAIIAVACVAVIAVVCTAIFWRNITNTLSATFMPAPKYYQRVETMNSKKTASQLSTMLTQFSNLDFNDISSSGELKIAVSKNLLKLIPSEEKEMLDWFSDASIKYELNSRDGKFAYDLIANLNSNNILTLKAILDASKLYVSVPELSDTYISLNLPTDELYESGFGEIEEIFGKINEIIPEEKVIERIVTRYVEILAGTITDVEKSKDTITVGDVSQSCTLLSAKIDGETMINIVEAVLKEAKKDNDIKDIIFDIAKADDTMDGDDLYDEFVEAIDDALEELDKETDVDAPTFKLKTWVDGKGNIIGRELKTDGIKLTYLAPSKSDKTGFKLAISSFGTDLSISGTGTNSKNKLSGNYVIKYNKDEIITIKVKGFDVKSFEEGYLNGQFTISIGKDAENLIKLFAYDADTTFLESLKDYAISFDFKNSSKSTEIEIALIAGEDPVVTLTITSSIGEGKKIDIPKEVIDLEDEEALEEYLSSMDFEKIFSNLKDAGVPDELIDLIKSSLEPSDEFDEEYYY